MPRQFDTSAQEVKVRGYLAVVGEGVAPSPMYLAHRGVPIPVITRWWRERWYFTLGLRARVLEWEN